MTDFSSSLPPDPGGSMLGPTYKMVAPSLARDDDLLSSSTARALQAAALLLLAVVGSGANTLVIVVFYRRPALRSPSNRFVLSLVLANLLASLLVVPVLLVQVLHRDMAGGAWLRQTGAGLTTLVVTASIFSILTIAVDRYNAVLSPLHYAMTITRQRSRGMIAGAWGVAGLLATPPLLGALLPPTHPLPQQPQGLLNCTAGASSEVFRLTYALVLVTLGFTLPLFALCWIYARMYNAAHRNSERTRRHSISTNPGELVSSRPGSRGGSLDLPQLPAGTGTPENFRRVGKYPPLSHVMVPRRRCSNASFSTLLFREEGRAVKTAAMVIASYLFCWTMYFATLLADTWGGVGNSINASVIPEQCRFLALLFALSSGCVTPFIYVFRNDAARNEAIRVILWWRSGKYGSNVARCGKDFDSYYSNGKPAVPGQGFGPPTQDNFALRRQSLSFCDTISVQSFQIPTVPAECRHCADPTSGVPTADFVATYEVIESPNDEEGVNREGTSEEEPVATKPATRTRRESVTFRLAFLPQRRCQTCIRQNSDSSSGSGHPLLRDGDSLDCRSPPTNAVTSLVRMTVSQRRQQFLLGRQGSSGEELTAGSGSESGTPRHLPFRRPLAIASHEDPDSPRAVFLNNNNDAARKGGAVILELEEQLTLGTRTPPPSAAIFQFQETSLERMGPMMSASQEQPGPVGRQDSSHSNATVRQDSNYSDTTVDSGFGRSHSSSSSLSGASLGPPARSNKRQRHKLQRLAAVEDEDAVPETPSVKSRLKSSFKSRFYRPAFRIPKVDF